MQNDDQNAVEGQKRAITGHPGARLPSRVRVKSCTPFYQAANPWYVKRVGEVFAINGETEWMDEMAWNALTPNEDYSTGAIRKCDAEPIYDEPEPLKHSRTSILESALQCVTKDRNTTHGEPEDNFGVIADLWGAYFQRGFSRVDVAVMMALVKVARIKTTPSHPDHWIDGAGYFACGGEIATKTEEVGR